MNHLAMSFLFYLNDELKESFQDGCDKIVGKITALGAEVPEPTNDLNNIIQGIQNVYDKAIDDVKANPANFGISSIASGARLLSSDRKWGRTNGTGSVNSGYIGVQKGKFYAGVGYFTGESGASLQGVGASCSVGLSFNKSLYINSAGLVLFQPAANGSAAVVTTGYSANDKVCQYEAGIFALS